MRKKIANEELTLADIPGPDADWAQISPFALTMNGYEVWGSSEKCAEVANARRHETLTELRACLFFEHRRWAHYSEPPDDEAMIYFRHLVEEIRRRVLAGDLS